MGAWLSFLGNFFAGLVTKILSKTFSKHEPSEISIIKPTITMQISSQESDKAPSFKSSEKGLWSLRFKQILQELQRYDKELNVTSLARKMQQKPEILIDVFEGDPTLRKI